MRGGTKTAAPLQFDKCICLRAGARLMACVNENAARHFKLSHQPMAARKLALQSATSSGEASCIASTMRSRLPTGSLNSRSDEISMVSLARVKKSSC